uniref:Multidrug MFS transporter n=1 Tax=Thermosporothrix sp. COM3 TaxID=2490863 RepID=A0A455SLN0_9CHLR|nr:multidrug MFS transporter [Thermosporothrix sp. COM3]
MAVLQQEQASIITFNPTYLKVKRLLDIVITLLAAPLLLFVVILIAICIKLDSEGPVFFRQKRIGQDGRVFEMLKFRSMYVDSDQNIHKEKIKLFMNGGKLDTSGDPSLAYKFRNDPRVTRVGRIIRKTSLDELPQFWNVLRGEMSLVGPRPPLPYEVEMYTEREWLRLCGKPGCTGTWQVYGRSRVSFQDMIEMDIEYLQMQSIWQDLKLIILTIPVMILGRGGA